MRWLDAWKAQLPDGTPCGQEDITFSTEFELLQAEISKDDSLQSSEQTDWTLVLEMSTSILSTMSKDLRVFCYGCRAAYAQSGLSGLSTGLEVLSEYLEKAWDELYPAATRVARRTAPFVWLISRLERLMPADAFPLEKEDTYEVFKDALHRLQTILDTQLGEQAPSFGHIRRAIPQKKPLALSLEPKPTQAVPTVPINADVTHILAGLDGDGRVPDSILPQLLRATTQQAQQLALHYFTNDILDWRVYVLHRTVLWTTVTQLPPVNADKITPLRLVLSHDKALSYAAAVNSRQYEHILPQLERSVSKAPFWFDGHHLVVRCLEALGAQDTRDIVCMILRAFLQRYPELLGYKFHDGTPFASALTLQWIDEMRQNPSGTASKGESGLVIDEQRMQHDEMLLSNALTVAETEHSFTKGLAVLGPSPGGRCRASILHGILQARYCLRGGKTKAGRELLLALYDRLENWGLLDWEPEIAAQIVALLISTGGDKGLSAIRQRLYSIHAETAIKFSE